MENYFTIGPNLRKKSMTKEQMSRFTIAFTMRERILLMQLAARKGMSVSDYIKSNLEDVMLEQRKRNKEGDDLDNEIGA